MSSYFKGKYIQRSEGLACLLPLKLSQTLTLPRGVDSLPCLRGSQDGGFYSTLDFILRVLGATEGSEKRGDKRQLYTSTLSSFLSNL